ncbi:MAG: S8 family peptidase [Methanothrix sp.]|nr:S8 family peptidase [Methanothrix sp.]
MNSRSFAYFILLAGLLSCAAAFPMQNALDNNKASIWFEKEYESYFKPNADDGMPPVIYGVSVSPSALKIGAPRSEINAFVHDAGGIEMVYADIGNRMNLMLDLNQDGRYTGYCGSNLPPGAYKVTIVAIDKSGNAAKDESKTLTIRDPNDLNSNGIEDSLEKQGAKDLKVIVLHDGNLSDVAPSGDRFHILPGSALTVSGDKLEKIARTDGVKGIFRDQKLKVLALPGKSSGPSSLPPYVDDPRRDKGYTGKGVTVALIDTGADSGHEALAGKIVAFKDFVNNQTASYDDNGHGTHCASLIAGEKGTGVAPGASLVVIKVMDREGACYLSDALKALDWCLENKDRYGIRVISFSVGGESPSDGTSLLDEACNKMVEKGLIMCVAAGNSGPAASSIVIPGDAENVITVGAVDSFGTIFELSSRGPTAKGDTKPDLVTFGVDVVSALAESKSGKSAVSGTSMAVPQVSGAAALLLEAKPDLAPADVKRVLLKTADDLGPPGQDNVYGYGALNLTGALLSISATRFGLEPPVLEEIKLNRNDCPVGEPVMIEAHALGDIRTINANIIGPDRNLEIPLDDFDGNGIFSARWETSFWSPGDYQVKVDLLGKFGEVDYKAVPFRLLEKR